MAYRVNLPSDTNKGRSELYTGNSNGLCTYKYKYSTYFLIAIDSSTINCAYVSHLSAFVTMLTFVHFN